MKKTIVAMFLYLLLIVSVALAEPIRFLNLEWGGIVVRFMWSVDK